MIFFHIFYKSLNKCKLFSDYLELGRNAFISFFLTYLSYISHIIKQANKKQGSKNVKKQNISYNFGIASLRMRF